MFCWVWSYIWAYNRLDHIFWHKKLYRCNHILLTYKVFILATKLNQQLCRFWVKSLPTWPNLLVKLITLHIYHCITSLISLTELKSFANDRIEYLALSNFCLNSENSSYNIHDHHKYADKEAIVFAFDRHFPLNQKKEVICCTKKSTETRN